MLISNYGNSQNSRNTYHIQGTELSHLHSFSPCICHTCFDSYSFLTFTKYRNDSWKVEQSDTLDYCSANILTITSAIDRMYLPCMLKLGLASESTSEQRKQDLKCGCHMSQGACTVGHLSNPGVWSYISHTYNVLCTEIVRSQRFTYINLLKPHNTPFIQVKRWRHRRGRNSIGYVTIKWQSWS